MPNPPVQNNDAAPQPPRAPGLKGPMLGRWRACNTCRSKKMRCDAAQPVCGPCTKLDRSCSYATVKKSPSATSAVVLSAKLSDLQEKLRILQARKALRHNADRAIKPESPAVSAQSPGDSTSSLSPPTTDRTSPEVLDLMDDERDAILEVFFKYQHRCGSQIHREYFFRSMQELDERLHPLPALLDIMLLIGIAFAELTQQSHLLPQCVPDPGLLVYRVHRGLENALHNRDRLLDYMQASVLLSCWEFHQGRFQEGQYVSATTFRFAIICQLHLLDGQAVEDILNPRLIGDNLPDLWAPSILGRPRNAHELSNRISIFWQCYFADKVYSLITGLPSACDESTTSQITTVWLRPYEEYESGVAMKPKFLKSMQQLFRGEPAKELNDTDPTSADLFHTYLSKGLALLDRATHISIKCSTLDPKGPTEWSLLENLTSQIQSLNFAIRIFESGLPPMENPLLPHQLQRSTGFALEHTRYSTIFVWLCIYVCGIYLSRSASSIANASFQPSGNVALRESLMKTLGSRDFLEIQLSSARKAIILAHDVITEHLRVLGGSSSWVSQFQNVCGFMMTSPALVFAVQVRTLRDQLNTISDSSLEWPRLSAMLLEAEDVLAKGLRVMEFLSESFPILKFQIRKVKEQSEQNPENAAWR